jgi:hypothetical protein
MYRAAKPTAVVAATLVAGCLTLAGCSDEPATRAGASSSEEDTGAPARLQGNGTLLSPGTYAFSFFTNPGVTTPDALVDVPEGFVQGDDANDWYVVSTDEDAFLGLWTVGRVERDACFRPTHDSVDPGPEVEGLADALVTQESTDATEPAPVTLDAFEGLYLELVGPSDLDACDATPGLWTDPGGRGIFSDHQVDHLWILDGDGQRLVVDASYGPTATPDEREALTAMVESLHFVAADQ